MLLSLISPQKNIANFARAFTENISWLKDYVGNIELIIVEDHSSDDSFQILTKIFSEFENVKVVRNVGCGKVAALNYGFSLSSGKYVRFIDGDDALLEAALDTVSILDEQGGDVISSSYMIKVTQKVYPVTSKFLRVNIYSHSKFYSPPRWNWTLSRKLALELFPIPAKLPFEDLYMAIKIANKSVKSIATSKIDYVYIQHDQQTYGGVHNSSRDLLEFRVNRNLEVLEYLKHDVELQPCVDKLLLNQTALLTNRKNLKQIVLSSPYLFALAFKAKIYIDMILYHRYKKIPYRVYIND